MKKLLLSYMIAFVFSQNLIEGNSSLEQKGTFDYYREHFGSVEGWYDKGFLDFLLALDKQQKNNNIHGNLGEIGVYLGKSFISLYLLAAKDELVLAVDIFQDEQPEYVSGIYQKFIQNLDRFIPNRAKYREIKGDSSKKVAQDYLSACDGMKFRIFSVDGCHYAKETEIDLRNAFESLVLGGIIIVDDCFHHYWPEVSEGLSQFLLNTPDAKPFFIGFNKLLITQKEYAPKYIEFLNAHFPVKRKAVFYNSPVLIY